MSWKVEYLPEAEKDLKGLDGSQRNLVLKAIKKVQQNPLPVDENGYGKPLGNHSSTSLAGLMKIKLRYAGLRIVYQLRRTETSMMIIVIGVRADEEVYELALVPYLLYLLGKYLILLENPRQVSLSDSIRLARVSHNRLNGYLVKA